MFARFEEALVEMLVEQLQQPPGDEDLRPNFNEKNFHFDPPTKSKVAGWTKPAVNIFLLDIRENNRLRGQQPAWDIQRNGQNADMRRQAVNFDLHYMITVWLDEQQPEQEHEILFALLSALLRTGGLPDKFRQGKWHELSAGVSFKVAQPDMHINPRDIWSVLDNEMRVAIDLVATVTFNPFHYEPAVPLVSEVDTIFHDMNREQP